jgi:hypothetical protein
MIWLNMDELAGCSCWIWKQAKYLGSDCIVIADMVVCVYVVMYLNIPMIVLPQNKYAHQERGRRFGSRGEQ